MTGTVIDAITPITTSVINTSERVNVFFFLLSIISPTFCIFYIHNSSIIIIQIAIFVNKIDTLIKNSNKSALIFYNKNLSLK